MHFSRKTYRKVRECCIISLRTFTMFSAARSFVLQCYHHIRTCALFFPHVFDTLKQVFSLFLFYIHTLFIMVHVIYEMHLGLNYFLLVWGSGLSKTLICTNFVIHSKNCNNNFLYEKLSKSREKYGLLNPANGMWKRRDRRGWEMAEIWKSIF